VIANLYNVFTIIWPAELFSLGVMKLTLVVLTLQPINTRFVLQKL
jgi:hypothetical protein